MDIQKAIEWQKAFKKTYNGMPEEVIEACDIAIGALEKQVQKKPDTETTKAGNLSVKCPNCKQELFKCGYFGGKYNWNEAQKWHKYCENCGQALDWSETESEVES